MARPHAQLPDDPFGRAASRAYASFVDAVQMMRGAHGNAVVARVASSLRAEHDMMVVESAPGAARRNRAAPPIAFKDRIAMPGLGPPRLFDVGQKPFEPGPG